MLRSHSLAAIALSGLFASSAASAQPTPHSPLPAPNSYVRINQLGYLPASTKVAVVCSLEAATLTRFVVEDTTGRVVFGPKAARASGAFGPCAETHRLDFSALRTPGRYRIVVSGPASRDSSPTFRVANDVYAGAADSLLVYLRQQRSGYNPFFRDSVHHFDGMLVDDSTRGSIYIPASGGWADASDYLQYVTTSATATYHLLMAARDHVGSFTDHYDARGLPGANGVPDVVDEARHGLEWLVAMYPQDDLLLNQLADDRDHMYLDLPPTDTSDYGWGKGKARPLYPCVGRPQGLFKYKNRSTGMASTAGKMAAAFALGAQMFADRDPAFAAVLRKKATAAYALGRAHPGACQTAPGVSPYFYEEDSWADDMELGAAALHALTGDATYQQQASEYAAMEPVNPWMGADTARHYQFYPWINVAHFESWRVAAGNDASTLKKQMAANYRRGLEAVIRRANNGFRVGIPFIWCSNDLMSAFATQAYLYRQMTGDTRFVEYEAAARDWLFGANPWGVSMVIGLPGDGVWAKTPHSVVANRYGPRALTGGLLDGPVYRSIYQNLKGIALHDADEYAPFNTGFIVYHDDFGDYSTNEPIMDGTAGLAYLLSALANGGH